LDYDRPHRLHDVVRSSYTMVDGTLAFEAVNGGTRLWWDLGHGPGRTDAVVTVIGPGWERRNWAGLMTYMESGRR